MNSVFFISLMNGDSWGGSEELWFQTALYAARHHYKVGCAFYHWPQKKERIEQLQKEGCEVYLFSNEGRQKRTLLERLQYKITKRKVRRFAHSLPVAQFDLTVINLGHLEIITPYWKDFYKHVKSSSLLFHSHNEHESIKPYKKPLLRTWMLQAKHNLFASARTKTYLEKQLSITLPNADTLINPLSFLAPQEQTLYPSLHDRNYLFVMLAALDTRRKAQDNLIKALSTQKWKERPWQLYLYGSGKSEQQLRNLIQETGLDEKIVLKGHTTDVKAALAEAHLLLQITHIDAMPLAVMEALAMARPLVVSNVGDMSKWVEENINGWISRDATVESIDETLEKCWQNKDRWEEMGKNAFQLFKKDFPAIPEEFFLKQLNSGNL